MFELILIFFAASTVLYWFRSGSKVHNSIGNFWSTTKWFSANRSSCRIECWRVGIEFRFYWTTTIHGDCGARTQKMASTWCWTGQQPVFTWKHWESNQKCMLFACRMQGQQWKWARRGSRRGGNQRRSEETFLQWSWHYSIQTRLLFAETDGNEQIARRSTSATFFQHSQCKFAKIMIEISVTFLFVFCS